MGVFTKFLATTVALPTAAYALSVSHTTLRGSQSLETVQKSSESAKSSESIFSSIEALEASHHLQPQLIENLKDSWFALQFVGLDQGNPAGQPNSPFEANSLCLTGEVPTSASQDGIPLNFRPCASFDLLGHKGAAQVSPIKEKKEEKAKEELGKAAKTTIDEELRQRQKFGFTIDGRVHSKFFVGKCLRRSLCGDRHMYDLAECDDAGVASFQISRSIASTAAFKPLGRPLQALAYDNGCTICGPYQLTQFCKGEQLSGSGKCVRGEKYEGWTRDQSQYIDLDKRAQRRQARNFFNEAVELVHQAQNDSGIGKIDDDVCGSTAGDYPSAEAFFYLKKFKPGKPH